MTDENSNALPTPTVATIAINSTNNTTNNNNNSPETVMAMVHNLMNVKDSRWLQLEVCREYQRGQCSRTENECKFAHPPPHVEVQNGRVTACYDSIKARCQRENPKCKYLHPPQHLKDQLLINGKNNLALKNLIYNQLSNPMAQASAPLVSQLGMTPNGNYAAAALTPGVAYSPYAYTLAANPAAGLYPGILSPASPDSIQLKDLHYVQQQQQPTAQTPGLTAIGDKMGSPAGAVFGMPHSQYITDQFYALQPQAIKRPAMDKSGVPVYQPFQTAAGLPPGTVVCSTGTGLQQAAGVAPNPAVTLANQAAAVHYAQLAAAGMPGLTSYMPAAAISSFYQYPSWYSAEDQKVGAHPATLQRFQAGPL